MFKAFQISRSTNVFVRQETSLCIVKAGQSYIQALETQNKISSLETWFKDILHDMRPKRYQSSVIQTMYARPMPAVQLKPRHESIIPMLDRLIIEGPVSRRRNTLHVEHTLLFFTKGPTGSLLALAYDPFR